MFTGIIEEIGVIKSLERNGDSIQLKVNALKVLEGTILGDSIAVNGVCQTVTKIGSDFFEVDVMAESIKKTTLGLFRAGQKVNLERAMIMGKPFGGHIVQGHVQNTARVNSMINKGDNHFLSICVSDDLLPYMIKEGSIAIDGLSLTISGIKGSLVEVNIIPHTISETTIGDLKSGCFVNVEPDILIKANIQSSSKGLTKEKLISWGY